MVDAAESKFRREDSPSGVSIRFQVSEASFHLNVPWVNGALVGVLPTAGQTIEDACGQAIRVESDLFGRSCALPVAGPLADLKPGESVLQWSMKR